MILIVPSRVTYTSDGLPVIAFIYRPSTAGDQRPVVVYNRGSYVRQGAARELLVPFHRLAEAGFVVVAPMYRGSEGAPRRDEMGGADLADLMNIRPVIASLSYADSANTFLYGESRGGMMVLQALRDGFRTRAAAIVGAFTDLEQYAREDPKALRWRPSCSRITRPTAPQSSRDVRRSGGRTALRRRFSSCTAALTPV